MPITRDRNWNFFLLNIQTSNHSGLLHCSPSQYYSTSVVVMIIEC